MRKGIVIELSPKRTRASVYINIGEVFEVWKIKLRVKTVELGDEIMIYDEDVIRTQSRLHFNW